MGTKFELSFLRPNQIRGLVDFDEVIQRNVGLVFVSFQNQHLDETYAIRLVAALRYLRNKNRQYIKLSELRDGIAGVSVSVPKIAIGYDLREVPKCFKSS